MDPFSIVSSTQAISRRFSFYIAVQVASVLAPGVVVIAGSIFVIELFNNQTSSEVARSIATGLSGTTGLLASFVLLAAGYVSGYVLRELAFKLLSQIERLPATQNNSRRDAFRRSADDFSPDLITECFGIHPLLREAYKSYEGSKQKDKDAEAARISTERRLRPTGGGHVVDMYYTSFVYAKLWIRNYAPGFSVDSIEAEINILASGLAPSLLGGLAIIAATHAAWWAVLVGALLVVSIWSTLLSSAIRLRWTERSEAIYNLVLDYSMRQAVNKYPVTQITLDNPIE